MAEPSTATEMVRVPILGENGRISDDYVPEAIPRGVEAVTQAAQAAAQSANESAQSATAAEKSASTAASSVEQAKSYANNASTYMSTAETHAESASADAVAASASASAAAESAKQAAESAASIGNDVTDAQSAAAAAKESAAQAATSASESASSAIAADDAFHDAEASATAAKASETAASSSAEQAATSATNASASASAAAGSATGAASSATAAEKSKTDAQAILNEANAKFIESAVATTLDPSQSATAEVVDNVLNLGIPKGDKGDKGDTGTGVPDGGEPGQLLSKADDGTVWVDLPSGNTLVGTTPEGEYVAHADDAYAAKPREIRIEGRTAQNLWPVINGLNNGITVSTDETGLITVSGTSTALIRSIITAMIPAQAGKMYTVVTSSANSGMANLNYEIAIDASRSTSDNDFIANMFSPTYGGRSKAFTTPDGTAGLACIVRVDAGFTVDASFRVMLIEGDTAPDCFTPVGVHGVEPEKLVVAGRNLVNLDGAEYVKTSSSSSSSATFGDDGSVTITGATDSWSGCYVELKSVVLPPGSYVASGFSNVNMWLLLTSPNVLNPLTSGDYYTDAGYPFRVVASAGQSAAFKIDAPSRVAFSIGDQIAEGASLTLYPQIEVGSTATEYEPPNVTEVALPETDPMMDGDALTVAQDGAVTVSRADGTTEQLGTVQLPQLPAPTFNVYPTSGYVPPEMSVEYEKDVNITINNMQQVIDSLVGGGN